MVRDTWIPSHQTITSRQPYRNRLMLTSRNPAAPSLMANGMPPWAVTVPPPSLGLCRTSYLLPSFKHVGHGQGSGRPAGSFGGNKILDAHCLGLRLVKGRKSCQGGWVHGEMGDDSSHEPSLTWCHVLAIIVLAHRIRGLVELNLTGGVILKQEICNEIFHLLTCVCLMW